MNWYVLITGINCEHISIRGLQAKGFETYCPLGKRTVRHARKQIIKQFPVFSRYIFIKFNIDDPSYSDPIRSTDGVMDILSNNWRPVEIPEWVIDDIKKREAQGKFDYVQPKTKRPRWAKSFDILKNLLNPDAAIQV
jgi:transcriptional antiterminator RfaH